MSEYRYRLDRVVSNDPRVVMYVGINPSTATDTVDDATVRKWKTFTRLMGAGRFVVGNVFAYRTTDVRKLAYVADPFGPLNLGALRTLMLEAHVLVPCWGDRKKVPHTLRRYIDMVEGELRVAGKPLLCFGRTRGGDPKHPLMLGYNTMMENF
jgi:hypothetical protein